MKVAGAQVFKEYNSVFPSPRSGINTRTARIPDLALISRKAGLIVILHDRHATYEKRREALSGIKELVKQGAFSSKQLEKPLRSFLEMIKGQNGKRSDQNLKIEGDVIEVLSASKDKYTEHDLATFLIDALRDGMANGPFTNHLMKMADRGNKAAYNYLLTSFAGCKNYNPKRAEANSFKPESTNLLHEHIQKV